MSAQNGEVEQVSTILLSCGRMRLRLRAMDLIVGHFVGMINPQAAYLGRRLELLLRLARQKLGYGTQRA